MYTERVRAVDAAVPFIKATEIPLMNSTCEVDYIILCSLKPWLALEHSLYSSTGSSSGSTCYILLLLILLLLLLLLRVVVVVERGAFKF